MVYVPGQDRQPGEAESPPTLNRSFAGVLNSILESASDEFRSLGREGVRFSVALVGEMGKDKFTGMLEELPVVAGIALTQELGARAALLTDAATASSLTSLMSDSDDPVLLRNALEPILKALSDYCEKTTGYPLGDIENIEASDPTDLPPATEELSKRLANRLCRAVATISFEEHESGKIALVLPRDLAKKMTVPPAGAESSAAAHEITNLDDLKNAIRGSAVSAAPAKDTADRENILNTKTGPMFSPASREKDSTMKDDASDFFSPVVPAAASQALEGIPAQNLDLIMDIQLRLTARLGQMEMPVAEILKLSPGSIIDIDRFVDEPVELVVNDRPIARGDIVVVQENFGIKISEIISPKDRIQSLR
jgi:flagellar motor switch protein FliN/FliY